jgi:hypothetical protein
LQKRLTVFTGRVDLLSKKLLSFHQKALKLLTKKVDRFNQKGSR